MQYIMDIFTAIKPYLVKKPYKQNLCIIFIYIESKSTIYKYAQQALYCIWYKILGVWADALHGSTRLIFST